MKKSLLVLMVVAVVAGISLASVSAVSAQGLTQGNGTAQGIGGNGGRGAGEAGNRGTEIENPEVHALEVAAWSDALGISSVDIDARRDAGETMSQIAISTGMTVEEFRTLKVQIKSDVADQALAAGYITADQASVMKQAGSFGGNSARGGMRGAGLAVDGTCGGLGINN